MNWNDPQVQTTIVGAIGSFGALAAALASYLRSRANSQTQQSISTKLDENTRLTQTAADNHADTMAKLDTLATKVVTVQPVEPPKKDPP